MNFVQVVILCFNISLSVYRVGYYMIESNYIEASKGSYTLADHAHMTRVLLEQYYTVWFNSVLKYKVFLLM